MPSSSRREFVQNSLAGLGLLSFAPSAQAEPTAATKRLKVVCVGGHPDDPESGCGGTLARLTAAGHSVSIVYLTRGESGIKGKSHEAAAQIRSKEAEAA